MLRLVVASVVLVGCWGNLTYAQGNEPQAGSTVLAFWAPGNAFFVATVVEKQGAGHFVLFEDGDVAVVPTEKILPNDIQVGSKVIARWNDRNYYPGTVDKIVGRALHIKYDDGDQRWVPWGWIAVRR